MNVLMISTDKHILQEGSAVRERMIQYGSLVDELHIIVFTERSQQSEIHNSKFIIHNSNVSVYPTNSKNKWMYVFDALRIGKQILEIGNWKLDIARNDSIISCQDPFETGLVARRLAKKFKLPLHVQVHTDFLSPHFTQSWLDRARLFLAPRILRRAHAIRVVSKRIRNSIIETYNIPAARISVLPIFVDAAAIESAPVTTSLRDAFPQFKNIILMVSRLAPEKNIPLALRAFAKVAKRYPDTGLVIVGDGPERPALEKIATDLSLHDNIFFEGARADVASFYKTATLFLHTSDFEGYGMVLVEAAAACCPIVTTDVGLVGTVLTTDHAFVCDPKDETCIARKLGLALENTSARDHLAASARKAIRSHVFRSHDAYLETYKKDWERALK